MNTEQMVAELFNVFDVNQDGLILAAAAPGGVGFFGSDYWCLWSHAILAKMRFVGSVQKPVFISFAEFPRTTWLLVAVLRPSLQRRVFGRKRYEV